MLSFTAYTIEPKNLVCVWGGGGGIKLVMASDFFFIHFMFLQQYARMHKNSES